MKFKVILNCKFLCAFFLGISVVGFTQKNLKLDPKLQFISPIKPVDVIILLNEQADLSEVNNIKGKLQKSRYVYNKLQETAQKTQYPLLNFLRENQIKHTSFYLVNMIRAHLTQDQIDALLLREEIKYIMQNGNLYQEEIIREPLVSLGSQRMPIWNLDSIRVPLVWNKGIKGQNTVIGGQDTGYAWEVGTIKSKYRGWNGVSANHNYNWHDAIHSENPMTSPGNPCGYNSTIPCDDNNHGTHTMGTMVGDLDNNGQDIGVAPLAKWIGCRNMEEGYGTLTTYTECFQWFLAPYPIGGNTSQGIPDSMPHVINNSWSCPPVEGCNSSNWNVMRLAIENLKLAGCVVVVSAGNNGSGCSSVNNPPGIFGESYSVGATNNTNQIASFSSRGHVTVDGSNRIKPDISAPGVSVRSCLKNGSFANYSGTSMAGPHVAGLVALMISANTALEGEVDKIQEIINYTAKHKTSSQTCNGISGTSIPNNTFGFGIIDADAAVEMVLPATYHPNVVYDQSIIIENHNCGLVLSNKNGQKIRIRINNAGIIQRDTNPTIHAGSTHISGSSLKLNTTSSKLIFKSANGKNWILKISDSGTLTTEEILSLPTQILQISNDLHIVDPKHGLLLQSPSNYQFVLKNTNLHHILSVPLP